MKYYLVPLYDAELKIGASDSGKLTLVDNIIVRKEEMNGCREIMTDSYFNLFGDFCFHGERLNREFQSIRKYTDCGGHQLIVKRADLNKRNVVSKETISRYVENYEDSKWKSMYENIVLSVGKKYMKSTILY